MQISVALVFCTIVGVLRENCHYLGLLATTVSAMATPGLDGHLIGTESKPEMKQTVE